MLFLRAHIPSLAFLLIACGTAPPQRLEPHATVEAERKIGTPSGLKDSIVPNAPPPARTPGKRADADEGCAEYMESSSSGVRATLYIKPKQLSERGSDITETLPSAWMMVEQGAPVSIADDFDHGISTEHRDMPDTLDVEIRIYARCADRKPYEVRHYGVWHTATGGYNWRRR